MRERIECAKHRFKIHSYFALFFCLKMRTGSNSHIDRDQRFYHIHQTIDCCVQYRLLWHIVMFCAYLPCTDAFAPANQL